MRIALIGLGMVAKTYGRAIAASGGAVSLEAVFARDDDARASFADFMADLTGSRPATPRSVEEIAADPGIEAVVLATPPNVRLEPARLLARSGKALLVEKPLERDSAGARRMVDVCAEAGVTLGVMLQHRARPAGQALKARLDAGEFGAPALVRIDVPWWREQGYYDEPGRGTYARDGGGVMITQAIHTLDVALWLAGPVRAVQGQASTSALHRLEAEDVVTAGLVFESGATGSLTATTAAYPGAPESVAIHCERASLRLAGGVARIDWHEAGRESEELGEAAATGSGADPMDFPHDWHLAVLTDFAEALRDGRPPMIPGSEALPVHRLIDAIALSSREGRRVMLDEIAT